MDLYELIDKINAKDFFGQYTRLTKIGDTLRGLSPFTREKTPSFFVNPVTKCFKCFSSGNGGGMIDFLKLYYKIDGKRAAEMLAEWAHTTLGEDSEVARILNHYKKKPEEKIEHQILPDNIMDAYEDRDIEGWINEGISRDTLKKYQVRYDVKGENIVFPIWDLEGHIISIKYRNDSPHWKEMNEQKYGYYYSINGIDFLYGFHFHKEDILTRGEVIIVEGEKSVMKLESNGVTNAVALGTSALSKRQLEILLKLRVKVVFALDNDEAGKKITKRMKTLAKYNKCYIMEDRNGYLDKKDAPIDKGIDVFNKLYEERRVLECGLE